MHWRVRKWTHSPRIAEIRLPGLGHRDGLCMHAGEVYPASERGARLAIRVSNADADRKDEGILRRRSIVRTRAMSPVGYSQRSASWAALPYLNTAFAPRPPRTWGSFNCRRHNRGHLGEEGRFVSASRGLPYNDLTVQEISVLEILQKAFLHKI